ncbi:MAG: LacI family DNA-binding transcriptional regulator [Fimbriimonas sp.]
MESTARSNGSTLREVAEAAGVSIAAASKVLHGRGKNVRVSVVRAEIIREAAEKLRYSPNALARSLRTCRTQTIGLIWEQMQRISDGPLYYVHLLDGVSQILFQQHYRLTILPEIPEIQPVRALSDGRLDGVIWCKMPDDPCLVEEFSHSPLKVVALNSPASSQPNAYPCVTCDNEGGVAQVVEHLVSLGHKRILFALDEGWQTTPDAVARLNGFRIAMDAHGLPFGSEDIVEWDIKAPALAAWKATNPPHTAIFAWHDGIAANILSEAASVGIRVPQDLSVVGFDSTMFCETTKPRLTAVRQPIREMAETAAQLLIDLVEGRTPSSFFHSFPCTLDVRDSTSHPPHYQAPSTQSRGNS